MIEEKLKELIINKYGSIRQFAIKIEIPYTTIDSILKRGIDNSNVGNVIKMCKELNLSIDKLMTEEKYNFTDLQPANFLADNISIPVYGAIKAGTPIEAQTDIVDYVDIPKEWTRGDKKYFGLRISGDSMAPKYLDNDLVIFESTQDYEIANGKDCAVMVDSSDVTFKNVSLNHAGITLIPLNLNNSDNYQPTFYDSEQIEKLPIRIIGIAREKRSKV